VDVKEIAGGEINFFLRHGKNFETHCEKALAVFGIEIVRSYAICRVLLVTSVSARFKYTLTAFMY
jgi:hypothetical protein